MGLVFGRTLVDGEDDAPRVHELQDQYGLTPLSDWGKEHATSPGATRRARTDRAPKNPLGPFATLNAMLEQTACRLITTWF